MDIDKVLEDLVEKYNLDFGFRHKNKKRGDLKNKIIYLLKEYLNRIPKNSRIAIRGGGEHTKHLLEILEELGYKKNIECIIDKDLKQQSPVMYNYISLDDIDNYNIDIVIISSYKYKEEMELELYNLKKNYTIINIYDYLYMNNIKINYPFYLVNISQFEPSSYEEIFLYKKKYLNENNLKLKDFYLRKLILSYINIRDFINSIRYINEYIYYKYSKYEVYEKFLGELNILFETIKSKISKRTHKDIIINWIDALSYDVFCDMEYLNKLADKSLFFENAFTFTPWTSSTMAVMMTNSKTIDNHLFNLEELNIDNSCVLKLLNSKGYILKYISMNCFRIYFGDKSSDNDSRCTCSTLYQWLLLKHLILIDDPCLFIVHNFIETHPPYISGELEKLKHYTLPIIPNSPTLESEIHEFNKQRKSSRLYLDSQIEWYDKFLNENCIKIYMSDHGRSKAYKDERLHTLLFLKGKQIDSLKCKRMFSYLNFYYLFKYILEPNKRNFENMFSDFIEFQELDFYHEDLINVVKNSIKNEVESPYFFSDILACRGIRTYYDKYVLYSTGDELYFILPDEDNNKANDPKYRDRINALRTLAGNYFIDIYKHDKFRYSRELYNILKKKNVNFLDKVLKQREL